MVWVVSVCDEERERERDGGERGVRGVEWSVVVRRARSKRKRKARKIIYIVDTMDYR